MNNLGDLPMGRCQHFTFCVHDAAGASVAFDAAPLVTTWKRPFNLGIPLGSDIAETGMRLVTASQVAGGPAGLYECVIVLDPAQTFWGTGNCFSLVVTGAVDGVPVAETVAQFTIPDPTAVEFNGYFKPSALSASGFTLPAAFRQFIEVGWTMLHGRVNGKPEARVVTAYDFVSGVGEVSPAFSYVPSVNDPIVFVATPVPPRLAESDFEDDAISARVIADGAVSVGSVEIPDGGITAAKIADGALTGSKFAASAVTALQTGLATAANLSLVADAVVSVLADTDTLKTDTANIKTRLPAALVGGKMDAIAQVTGLDAGAIQAIADDVLKRANAVEPGLNLVEAMRLTLAYVFGLTTGFTGNSPQFKSVDLVGNQVQGSKVRASGVINGAGERSAVTVDVSDV